MPSKAVDKEAPLDLMLEDDITSLDKEDFHHHSAILDVLDHMDMDEDPDADETNNDIDEIDVMSDALPKMPSPPPTFAKKRKRGQWLESSSSRLIASSVLRSRYRYTRRSNDFSSDGTFSLSWSSPRWVNKYICIMKPTTGMICTSPFSPQHRKRLCVQWRSADGRQRPSACTFTNHDHASFLIASTMTIVSLVAPRDGNEESRVGQLSGIRVLGIEFQKEGLSLNHLGRYEHESLPTGPATPAMGSGSDVQNVGSLSGPVLR